MAPFNGLGCFGNESLEPCQTSFAGQNIRGHPPWIQWRTWHWERLTASEPGPLPPQIKSTYYKVNNHRCKESQYHTKYVAHDCSISKLIKKRKPEHLPCLQLHFYHWGWGDTGTPYPLSPGLTAITSTSLQNITEIFLNMETLSTLQNVNHAQQWLRTNMNLLTCLRFLLLLSH